MANKKKNNKSKINIYWFYASIVFFILSIGLLGGDAGIQNTQSTDISSFENYLRNGDIEKVSIINQRYARITLNENALDKDIHKRAKSKNFLGQDNLAGPHYQFEIGTPELFETKLQDIRDSENINFSVEFLTMENRWLDILLGFLPIIIIIGVWIFLMRRMSGGGGGGAGGQIFNIGKSKAKLFDQNTDVKVVAATNRADVLDKALMRAGRFDRQIFVDLPDLNERREIFKVHLKPLKKSSALDVEFLAKQTPGFSGADIANVCNEAALIAARNNKKSVGKQDFLDAVDRIVGGLEKKNKIISKEEKNTIAFHEAGHAIVSWLLEHAAPLVKVTIVPRGQSLGAAWYLPEERMIVRTEQMLDEMCATLGGRAAEKIMFNKISTGALSDLEKVTKQARAIVSVYGLNDKIGNITYYDSSGQGDYNFTKPYSEETARKIDEEISLIIEKQYKRACMILKKNKTKLSALASRLLEKEVIFKEDLVKILGDRPYNNQENKD